METGEVLQDAFNRVREVLESAVEGLDKEGLAFRPDADANSIAWLGWHLTRTEDDHVSEIAGLEQAWISEVWHKKFSMPADRSDTGYGHSRKQVAAIRPQTPEIILAYHDAVATRTGEYLKKVDAKELDRIIDRSYDPPVSVGVRLVSVIADNLQHAGQARYVRGIVDRRK